MDLVTIRTFQNYFSAHILLTKLRSSGIECYLKDEFTVTVDPFLSNAVGGIKLVVKKEFEKEANEMLRLFDDEYMQSVVCPKCGSHSISLVPKQSTSNMVTAVLSWLLGTMPFPRKMFINAATVNMKAKICRKILPMKLSKMKGIV